MAYSKKEIESIFNKIIKGIEEGNSLRSMLINSIDAKTFYSWIDKDEDKLQQYARATELRADIIFEECLQIADKQGADVYKDKDGNERTDHNVIQRSRLQVDTRKWMAGKLRPKKYGDKSTLELEGNEEKPIKITFIE